MRVNISRCRGRDMQYLYWTLLFFGVGKCGGQYILGSARCDVYVRPGKVVFHLEDVRNLSSSDTSCGITSAVTHSSYTLTLWLRGDSSCPRGQPVVMSFTGPFLAHGEDDATFSPSTDTPDCAVHMMPVREDDCKQRPLANCVHTWEFKYLYDSQPECSPLKSQSLTIEPNQIHQSLPYTPPHNVSSNITNCEGMNALLRDSETDQLLLILKVLIEWDPHIKARIKECGSLLLIERLLHRSTNEAQQTVSDSLGVVSGFVTVYNSTTQVNNNFFISLPSQAHQQTSVQKGPCVSVDDDVTMEVPKDVLSQLRNRSGGQLNIGAFWFHQDSLFPVDDPNVTLLSPRVVALDLGQEISGLQQPINISFYLKQPINSSIYLQQPINSSVHQNVSSHFS